MTDVREAGGTEECVADGVRQAVRVAVALEAVVGGEAHAAEDHGAIGDDAVDVVAVADAERSHER